MQVSVSGGSGEALCMDGSVYGDIDPPPSTSSSTLVARHSGKCLDVSGSGTADGTNIQQWNCNGTNAQAFNLEDLGNGTYRMVNVNSNKCVDVSAAGTADGTNVELWTCNGTGAQSFRIEPLSGGYFQIVNTNSNKCLDVAGVSTTDGANIQQWACHGGENQQWQISNFGCSGVTLYQHANYGGYSATLAPGDYTLSALISRGVQNDDVSSIRVPSGCTATLYQHDNFGGTTLIRTSDDASLVDEGWNDFISSIRIR